MSILLPWSWDSDPEIVKQAITVGSVSNPKPLSLLVSEVQRNWKKPRGYQVTAIHDQWTAKQFKLLLQVFTAAAESFWHYNIIH